MNLFVTLFVFTYVIQVVCIDDESDEEVKDDGETHIETDDIDDDVVEVIDDDDDEDDDDDDDSDEVDVDDDIDMKGTVGERFWSWR